MEYCEYGTVVVSSGRIVALDGMNESKEREKRPVQIKAYPRKLSKAQRLRDNPKLLLYIKACHSWSSRPDTHARARGGHGGRPEEGSSKGAPRARRNHFRRAS